MMCVTGGPLGEQDDLSRQAAARELIDADERNSTANGHFLKLEAAVDALGGSSRGRKSIMVRRLRRPLGSQQPTATSHRRSRNGLGTVHGGGGRLPYLQFPAAG